MKAKTLTVEELLATHPSGDSTAEGWTYKFVRIGDEYRFVKIDWHCASHRHMVGETEVADSAGSIRVYGDSWSVADLFSMSLNVGMSSCDDDRITALLGRPRR
jgi:hypothetical protein